MPYEILPRTSEVGIKATAPTMEGAMSEAVRALAAELKAAGVIVEASTWGLLAEEAPYAYKEVSTVVDICEGSGLSRKVARLRPLAVVKG